MTVLRDLKSLLSTNPQVKTVLPHPDSRRIPSLIRAQLLHPQTTEREKTTREEVLRKKIKRKTITMTDMRTEWARRAKH